MQSQITTYVATLREQRHEYGDIHTFIFDKPEGLAFDVGNYVHIRITSVPPPHKAVRELSFASAPSDEEVVFTTTVASHSPWKETLLTLVPGDTVELFKIKGYLHMPVAGTVIMIGGGIGVTPFRSILREQKVLHTPITPILVHIAREQYLYEAEFALLPYAQHRITREESEETIDALLNENPEAHYMIAGAPAFVDDVVEKLLIRGVREDVVQTDSFDGLL